jgi:hypothetical protein
VLHVREIRVDRSHVPRKGRSCPAKHPSYQTKTFGHALRSTQQKKRTTARCAHTKSLSLFDTSGLSVVRTYNLRELGSYECDGLSLMVTMGSVLFLFIAYGISDQYIDTTRRTYCNKNEERPLDAGFEHMGTRARDRLIILADAKFTVTSCTRRPLAEFVFHRRFRCRSLDFRSVIGATGWRWRTLSN